MKLTEICNSFFKIERENDYFLLIKDGNAYQIKIYEQDDDLDMVFQIITELESEKLTELNKNGIHIKRRWRSVITPTGVGLSDSDPLIIKRNDNREELFGRRDEKLHPDIAPDFDQNIYKGRVPQKGMLMGPDDEYFNRTIKSDEDDVRVPEFAKYDPIMPGRKKRTGPDPDHLKKPGNFPDDPDLF